MNVEDLDDLLFNCEPLNDFVFIDESFQPPSKRCKRFTGEEDEIIRSAVKEGYGWAFIGQHFLPGRLRHVIKDRYGRLEPGALKIKRNLNKEKEWIAKNKI